jgi:Neisseria PilC beta-propeller domain
MMKSASHRIVRPALILGALALPVNAFAQLDPLLFLKTTQPNVLLLVDTADRMQYDADLTYYDPGTYIKTGALYEGPLGITGSNTTTNYKRRYVGLTHRNSTDKFDATTITIVGDREAGYSTFYEKTRLAVARRALVQAINDNFTSARFALLRMRQTSPVIGTTSGEGPVTVSDVNLQPITDRTPGKWNITRTDVSGVNNNIAAVQAPLVAATAVNANTTVRDTLNKNLGTAGALIPAGRDTYNVADAPLGNLIADAKVHAKALIDADLLAPNCRNTIAVMITGGGEGTGDPAGFMTKVTDFMAGLSGRRVPLYIIAIAPAAADVAKLQEAAAATGGRYIQITKAMIDAVTPGTPVPEAVAMINMAVQHAFSLPTDFNTAHTVVLPFGTPSEFQVTSPIVGTADLQGASKIGSSGALELIPDTESHIFNGTALVPQRSNVLVTTGFELPGFASRVRAFRTYKPVPDSSKPSGYRFQQDGSRLWVNSTPAAGSRNIYTVLPGSTSMVPFTTANAGNIDDYLGVSDPSALIDFIRSQPMGAVVGSTPAFLDAPSLDPPPDVKYPTFVEENEDRRALIFIGANDGMMHALDARTGVEVWAFIPFNLLPKLKALRFGQSIDTFKYFVDSSPKISDVRVGDDWRTYLFFGQGPGGTFYNTLDVTLAGMSSAVAATSTDDAALLSYFASESRITFAWSFPRLTSFDATLAPYGELGTGASAAEKAIGETWSDPAIGQVQDEAGPYVMVTGSGFLKYSVQNSFRTGVTRAGTTFYVLDVVTGEVLGTPQDVGADANAETTDDCRVINDCRKMKNALQMDPVATGAADQRFITRVYIGDLDGKVWRFTLAKDVSNPANVTVSAPTQLYSAGADFPLFASMATVNVGNADQYIFVGTGSDLLPSPDAVNKPVVHKLLVLLETGSIAIKKTEIALEITNGAAGDEKVSAFPAVAGDIVFFTTTTYNPTTPCTPFSANLYAFTFIGGPAYDTNNDGQLSTGTTGSTGGGKKGGSTGGAPADSTKVFSTANVRATAPFIVDQHLVFSTGGNIQMFGDPNDFNNGVGQAGVRILSWRVVK